MSETRYWITIERLAELHGSSVRTAWRTVDRERLSTVKKSVPGEVRSIRRSFILAEGDLRALEIERCRQEGTSGLKVLQIDSDIYIYGYGASQA
jgi:hypothetical protein